MQYKIPVQIENEDPIVAGLSLRQLFILMVWGGFAYLLFGSLEPKIGTQAALIPSWIIVAIAFLIAKFKIHEMTFVVFLLSFFRLKMFPSSRVWDNSVDSFQPFDIGYVTQASEQKKEKVDIQDKAQSLQELQDKLSKI